MRSFIEWFKASTKVKRWILLIIFGMVLTCYGIAKILVSEEISFFELGKTITIFVIGFISIVISIVFIQKRSLEIIIEANNTTETGEKAKSNIKSLIFNRKVYEEGPKVVVIGGGPGLNNILEGFKKYTNNITAIVNMADYTNVSGADSFKDIKDAITSMSNNENEMSSLMNLNFKNEKLYGLNFGDLYLVAMNEIYSNMSEAILRSSQVLNISGKVLPVTLDEITLCADLSDGTTIKQKDKIPEAVASKSQKINRIYVTPSNAKPAPGVVEAIEDAEIIIIGPGSLYTNVLPNLLVRNISKAVKDSKATKYYISNIMTEPGRTENYTLSEHLKALQEHVGTGIIDYCLADTGEVVPEYVRKYNKEGQDIVEIDNKKINEYDVKVIQKNLSCIKDGKIMHDSSVVASTIIEMVCNDLKFHDMQNDTQYLLLKSVLKEQKKLQQKSLVKIPYKTKIDFSNTKSKFKEKYKDRVDSIQNTDKKIIENQKIAEQIEKIENDKKNKAENSPKREPMRRNNKRNNN